jgi:PAS domain S-box-containing protein
MNATGPASPTDERLQPQPGWIGATSRTGAADAVTRISASQFHAFYDPLPIGILLLDDSGALIAFNPAAYHGLGYDRVAFASLGLADLDLTKTGDELASILAAVRPETEMRLETRHRRQDGTPSDRLLSLSLVECDGEPRILAICTDMTEKKRAEAERHELLRRLYHEGEAVRRQIARELHDGVGQDLTGLMLGMSALEDEFTDEDGRESFRELINLAGTIGQKLHRITWEQRAASSLEEFGLRRALESFSADWAKRYGVALDLQEVGLGDRRLANDVEMTAQRIVQALLLDLSGNLQTRAVSIVLELRSDMLQIILEHDGEAPEQEDDGTADQPSGTDERLSFVGGSLSVESGCGLGTTVYVRIPLAAVAQEALG